ncbi:TPA: hypothetical protein I9080_001195 [Clostridium perfringens]|uniref:Uncharacterized protein n=1 Tax=Clostridium perfringens TaxID=1502 RepID=A0A8H9UWE5_CLOPF|nr:hypothetical protein [Clostridium perfringens]
MKLNLQKIDGQKKIRNKDQVILFFYYLYKEDKCNNYNEFLITEDLINNFNNDIEDEVIVNKLYNYIKDNYDEFKELLNEFSEEPWKYANPVIWENNYNNEYFIKNLILSHRFEVYIDNLFKKNGVDIGLYYGRNGQYTGESEAGIEIKRDMRSLETGNMYFEYMERHYNYGEWVNSGILKDDNTRYFLIGDINEFYIIPKVRLCEILEKLMNKEYVKGARLVEARRGTSKGFIISKSEIERVSLSLEDLINDLKD